MTVESGFVFWWRTDSPLHKSIHMCSGAHLAYCCMGTRDTHYGGAAVSSKLIFHHIKC